MNGFEEATIKLRKFAVRLEWGVRFWQGVRQAIALASSEEEAAAWMEWMKGG